MSDVVRLAERPSRVRLRGALLATASFVLIAVAFLSFFARVLGPGLAGHVYNSDVLHAFMVVQDLLSDPSSVLDWYHSPALYVFPDWLLAAPLVSIGLPSYSLPLLAGAMLLTLHAFAGGWLVAEGGGARVPLSAWVVAAALLLAGSAACLVPGQRIAPLLVAALGSLYVHSGAALSTIVGATLLVRLLAGQPNGKLLWLLAAVVFAASFSDRLFVVWFVGPAVGLAALVGWSTRTRFRLGVALTLAVVSVGAVALETVVRGRVALAGYLKSSANFADPVASAAAVWAQFREEPREYVVVVMLGLAVAMIVRAAGVVLALLRRREPTKAALIEGLLGAGCAAAVLAPLAIGAFSELGHWRYFLVLFVNPLLWVALLLTRCESRRIRNGIAVVAVLVVLGAAGGFASGARDTLARLRAPSAVEACIRSAGRTDGLGDYWNAKLLMFMTGRGIHVAPIDMEGDPFRWNTNERWFRERADGVRAARPDFIIVERLDAVALDGRFGPPARTAWCGSAELWFYDHPLDEQQPATSRPTRAAAARMLLPIVAQTRSYSANVYVNNAGPQAITVRVAFLESNNSPTPGERACADFPVPPHESSRFELGRQCGLGQGSHFGMLRLEETTASHPFATFARNLKAGGGGLTVDGFPIAGFGAGPVTAGGLRRSAGAPVTLTNCFVGALGAELSYRIELASRDGAPIGVPLEGRLKPYHSFRYADVLAAARAPAGDYADVRATFGNAGGGDAPLVGFCTVEEGAPPRAELRMAQ